MDLTDVMQMISAVVYGSLAAAALRVWRRQRSGPSVWLAATFLTLGAIVLATAILPEIEPDADYTQFSFEGIYVDIIVITLLAFPYLLHRFARSFRPDHRVADRLADASMALIVVATIAMPPLAGPSEDPTALDTSYRLLALAWWGVMLSWVALELWRAGRRQPGVVRRRVRLMSAATLLMNAALLAGTVDDAQPEEVVAVVLVSNLLGWASAAVFWLGFAPPSSLRRIWRTSEEIELRRAETGLVSALSAEEAAAAIVRPAARLLGGSAAVIVDQGGHTLAQFGQLPDEADRDGVTQVHGRAATMTVARSPYTPVFGEEEEELLRQLSSHLDLGLERLSAYEESERARLAAEMTNAELQQLVYGISHDLRNPLVTVSGFLRLLDGEADKLSDQGQMLLERMRRSTDYMENLIDDLLQLSRVGRTDRETAAVDVAELAADIAEDLVQRYEDLSISVETTAVIAMNPLRARQLFTNLLENAARHGGKPLHIEVRDHEVGPATVTIDVADDGVGIPEEHRERVFQIFQRMKGFDASAPGSGIGLTMCRRIAEDAGGTLEIADDPHLGGTTMRLHLTLVSSPAPASELDRATAGAR